MFMFYLRLLITLVNFRLLTHNFFYLWNTPVYGSLVWTRLRVARRKMKHGMTAGSEHPQN